MSELAPVAETVDELSMLKTRAKLMGIVFSNNIGVESLKEKIQQKMDGEEVTEPVEKEEAVVNPLEPVQPAKSLRQHMLDENMKLVRIRVTNMDPKKKDLPGEVFTIANEYLGTVRKFVPYGEVTEEGYHVPYCIYQRLEARKFLNIRTTKLPNGQLRTDTNWVREFALEVLPPLTASELKDLAIAQQAAGGT
jgi:hypothetical protein